MSIRKTARPHGKGIHNEPAYMLHRYEWSESSLILELLTRNLGRVAVVAKGVRRPASSFRSVLLPFQPLLVSLSAEGEVRTLKGAEWAGGYAMPTGESLLIGYYLNELLMRLFARDDPQPDVFDVYAQTLAIVAQQKNEQLIEPMLRIFELMTLRSLGVLPALDRETSTGKSFVCDQEGYALDIDMGLIRVDASEMWRGKRASISGQSWLLIQQALDGDNLMDELPLAVAPVAQELKMILRPLLNHYIGTEILHTRQLMRGLQKLKR